MSSWGWKLQSLTSSLVSAVGWSKPSLGNRRTLGCCLSTYCLLPGLPGSSLHRGAISHSRYARAYSHHYWNISPGERLRTKGSLNIQLAFSQLISVRGLRCPDNAWEGHIMERGRERKVWRVAVCSLFTWISMLSGCKNYVKPRLRWRNTSKGEGGQCRIIKGINLPGGHNNPKCVYI